MGTCSKPSNTSQYRKLIAGLQNCSPPEKIAIQRRLCRTDLYFLLWFACNRQDIEHEWLLARCREVEAQPDGMLDLWAREHYKSTVITFGKTLQDILASHGDEPLPEWNGVEPTFGIFSHTRPIAKGFLRQIKRECEANDLLKALFPDVLWSNPGKEAPTWSEDGGIIFRRKSNPKEATVEAWGLVDGQPTSKHFTVLEYDDVVVEGSVTTPEMMAKTMKALENSYNLGARGGRQRFIGTRYHFGDAYKTITERGTAIPRKHPATEDGTVTGKPVLLTPDELAKKRRDQGPYVFGCQMLLDPKSEEQEGFLESWLRYYKNRPSGGNRYIVVDPANKKRKKSDFTAVWVFELREDRNYYAIDIYRDRLSLTERADLVFRLHREYRPLAVGYEEYGMQADIEHIKDRQERENYRFDIRPLGGKLGKYERIKRLVPIFEQARFWLPETLVKQTHDGRVDVVQAFVNDEYKAFPVSIHDDMLDSAARILDDDLHTEFPSGTPVDVPTVFPSEF